MADPSITLLGAVVFVTLLVAVVGQGNRPYQRDDVDAAYYSSTDQQIHPESTDPYYQQQYDAYYGPPSSRVPEAGSYYALQAKDDYEGSYSSGGGGSYGPAPSYSKKPKKKKPEKNDDFLWDLFFGKKKKSEKGGGDDDFLWQLFFGKKKAKEDSKPSQGYGEPPAEYHHDDDDKEDKEFIFKKIQIMAITATALLITLGGGITLAPLLIGKGKGKLRELREMMHPDQLAQLTEKVLRAIQGYELDLE